MKGGKVRRIERGSRLFTLSPIDRERWEIVLIFPKTFYGVFGYRMIIFSLH